MTTTVAPVAPLPVSAATLTFRRATTADAHALERLIRAHRVEGRLLPRGMADLARHAPRFVVAVRRGRIVACAELAPLSRRVAEVRSLVVQRGVRGRGVARQLVTLLERDARGEGFEQLCAFAHDAAPFVRMGFSLVPHSWVPEKIERDCAACVLFRHCGQHALVFDLAPRTSPRVLRDRDAGARR
jgi:amino-acid N-acetyltransferase